MRYLVHLCAHTLGILVSEDSGRVAGLSSALPVVDRGAQRGTGPSLGGPKLPTVAINAFRCQNNQQYI